MSFIAVSTRMMFKSQKIPLQAPKDQFTAAKKFFLMILLVIVSVFRPQTPLFSSGSIWPGASLFHLLLTNRNKAILR